MFGTALTRTYLNPWAELRALDSIMEGLLAGAARPERLYGYPRVEAWVDGDEAMVEAEVPGIDPKDIEISVNGRLLTISGERKAPELGEGESYHIRERWHGKFERALKLPFSVDADAVKATFSHGLLKVTLPKAEAEKPRRIEIAAS